MWWCRMYVVMQKKAVMLTTDVNVNVKTNEKWWKLEVIDKSAMKF